jgi:hypothetical protein
MLEQWPVQHGRVLLSSEKEGTQTYLPDNGRPASCVNECYYIFFIIIYSFTIILYDENQYIIFFTTSNESLWLP